MGFPTKLSEDGKDADVIDHSAEIRKWRHSFLFSLVTGLPVMIIMLYFMINARVNPCPMDESHHNMTPKPTSGGGGATSLMGGHGGSCAPMICPGLSLENLLLFIFCTLCQVNNQIYKIFYAFQPSSVHTLFVLFRFSEEDTSTLKAGRHYVTKQPTWMF